MDQIITHDYKVLEDAAHKTPVPNNKSLRHFAEWAKKNQTPVFNRKNSSYGLKHTVEKLSDLLGKHEYCSNADLILSLVREGVVTTNVNPTNMPPTMNYFFKIKKLKDGDLEKLADSIDGGGRLTPEKEEAEKSARRAKAAGWRKEVKSYIRENGLDEYLHYTYYAGGQAALLPMTHHPRCYHLSHTTYNYVGNLISKLQQISEDVDNNIVGNKWVTAYGMLEPYVMLEKISGVRIYDHGRSLQVNHDDFELTIIYEGKRFGNIKESTVIDVFLHGNDNAITEFEEWMIITTLKAS